MMLKRQCILAAVAAAVGAFAFANANTASAQPASAPPAPPPEEQSEDARRDLLMPPEAGEREEPEHLLTPFGMALSIGGGVQDFTATTARDTTSVAGAWGARLTLGTRLPVALELAYQGSAQEVDALGLDNSAVLLGNGGEAAARVNILTGLVQPYVFGGAGWTHYALENEDFNTSAVSDSDDVYYFPMGAGVGLQYKGLLVDARGHYRYAIDEDLFGEDQDLDSWGANANVGFEF